MRSRQLRRVLGLVRPHRRILIIGIVTGILAAACQVGSVTGVLPILQIMIEGEGLHAWAERKVAEQRLGADLDLYNAELDPRSPWAARSPVIIRRLSPDSALQSTGIRQTDLLLAIDGKEVDGRTWIQWVAEAPDHETLSASFAPIQGEAVSEFSITVPPAKVQWHWLHKAVSLIPRPAPGEGQLRTMSYVVIGVICIALVGSFFRFVSGYFTAITILRATMDLRRTLYGKVLRLPMGFFTNEVSDTVSKFVQDSEEIQRGLQTVFVKLVREPATALFLFIAALAIDWRITVAVAVAAPIIVVIFWLVGNKVRKANRRLLKGWGQMVGALEATLRGISIVKAYNAENAERRRLWKVDRRMFAQQLRMSFLDALIGPSMEVLTLLAACSGLMWLAGEVLTHRIEKGSFLLLGGLLAMMFDPLRKSANVYNRLQRARAAAERIYAVIDQPAEAERAEGRIELTGFRDRIEFDNVSLTYPDADRPALRDVTLSIQRGETVALVGPNGSGKTTIINSLLRFYDPHAGTIRIDGIDTRSFSLNSLRGQFSLVTQEPVVFAMTMAENIAYGCKEINLDRVTDAARHAFADEFISLMEKKYETVAGDYGRTMSGGQRQRIAIARAILRNAPILIFDEATSQVDSESEQKIQTALKELARDRTTIIVAHRLSTIKFASRIVVLDRGRISDMGTHEELYHRSTLYRTLCDTQFVSL